MMLALLIGAGVSGATRPNLLFILTDDQSHRTVGAYPEAHPWVRTPHLDALARRGVRFAHAYVGTWCMPARATLLTGRQPYAVGSMRMQGEYPGIAYDPRSTPFWPRSLRESGYFTAHIGKWHLGSDTGAGRDWDYQASWSRPPPETPGSNESYYLDQRLSFNGVPPVPVAGYATDNYTAWAESLIRGDRRPPDRPWFLWLCYTAPHAPYTAAARHEGTYATGPVPIPADIYPPRPGKPGYMQQVREWVEGAGGQPHYLKFDGESLENGVRRYHEVVSAVDESVGRLLAALEDTGQLENTLVVFTSDQGFAWGQHGFRKKVAPYDANLRAPLIISQAGAIPSGRTVEFPIGGVDLVATLFEMMGISPDWKAHGRSFASLLRGTESDWTHPVLLAYTGWTYGSDTERLPVDGRDGHARATGVPWYVFYREGTYKYIRTLVPGEPEELYDLAADPEELSNLGASPSQRSRLERMRENAIRELRRTEAPFVDSMPALLEHGS